MLHQSSMKTYLPGMIQYNFWIDDVASFAAEHPKRVHLPFLLIAEVDPSKSHRSRKSRKWLVAVLAMAYPTLLRPGGDSTAN